LKYPLSVLSVSIRSILEVAPNQAEVASSGVALSASTSMALFHVCAMWSQKPVKVLVCTNLSLPFEQLKGEGLFELCFFFSSLAFGFFGFGLSASYLPFNSKFGLI
jgi:hypothetical protein